MPDLRTMEDRAYQALMQRQATYEREVQLVLRETLDDMRLQMSKLYERYSVNGVLTHAEMSKYNRLATAEQQLLRTVDPATRKVLRTINRLGPEQYDAAFFHYAWAVDNATGLRLAWGVLNRDVILENLANEFAKISKTRYAGNVQLTVRSALNKGLATGKGYAAMVKDLKVAINSTYAEALRILRTEGQRAATLGSEDAFTWARRKGVEGIIHWDATLDGRTRPEHAALDGVPKNEEKGGWWVPRLNKWIAGPLQSGDPAFDINCRCRERLEIEGYSPQLRRSREGGVIPYQTFQQWDHGRAHVS